MYIPPEIVHDLKTERTDVLPPLPAVVRLVPILFYLSAASGILLSVLTVLEIGRTTGELAAVRKRTAETRAQVSELTAARASLETRAKRASDFLQWVEGAVNVQPLAVSISRSIDAKSSITELALSRNEEAARQIQLALKFQAADASQLDATVEAIRQCEFRPFSAQQNMAGSHIDYEATLLRQTPSTAASTPSPER